MKIGNTADMEVTSISTRGIKIYLAELEAKMSQILIIWKLVHI